MVASENEVKAKIQLLQRTAKRRKYGPKIQVNQGLVARYQREVALFIKEAYKEAFPVLKQYTKRQIALRDNFTVSRNATALDKADTFRQCAHNSISYMAALADTMGEVTAPVVTMDAADNDDNMDSVGPDISLAEINSIAANFYSYNAIPGMAELIERLEKRFEEIASGMISNMFERVAETSMGDARKSLRELSDEISIQYSRPPEVDDLIRKRIDRNVGMIKRIPARFLGMLSRDVQKAVLGGSGLQEVQVLMAERYGTQDNWYKHVARDQINKSYEAINHETAISAGVEKFQWIHHPIAKEPREYHKRSHKSGGLNGGIYDYRNLPIIDLDTGQRGRPAELPFCNCTARWVIE